MSMSDDRTLDGNAAAGMLAELFAVDMTTVVVTCAGCGTAGPLGGAAVYATDMGMVARCTNCSAVLMRGAELPDRVVVDLRGAVTISVAVPG
jgi:hypothetical protein